MPNEYEGICYSGYRDGQSPDEGVFPTLEQVSEDLRILAKRWSKIRIYDSGPHADLVLEAIRREGLDLQVLIGAYIKAEASNPDNPWGGGQHDGEILAANARENEAEVERAIALAQRYPGIVSSVSVGNEATVSWTDHLVPVERVIGYARAVKAAVPNKPVTFCENHVPWLDKLEPLVRELDFISVHTYPVWEYRSIDEALAATDADYRRVQERYPGVAVAITEAGWTTRSNGRGIEPWNASPELQTRYYGMLSEWARDNRVLTYVFEAFDEAWKGSDDPDEPEKHWGLFTIDRRPKPVMVDAFPELAGR